MTLSPAESLLFELGVTHASEINLPVIAHYLGVRIKYSSLDGCEARIIGVRDRAIIRVRSDAQSRRKRFSIAHELGHWQLHRGLDLACGERDFRPGNGENRSREAAANSFAGKLLLPGYLLDKSAKQHSVLDFTAIGKIADEFDTSHTATALRLLERRHAPMILISYSRYARVWWKRSIDVPFEVHPVMEPHPETEAFKMLHGEVHSRRRSRSVDARLWFNGRGLDGMKILEDCLNIGGGQVLVLLLVTDRRMLNDA